MPYLLNAWYAAAWIGEIKADQPLARTLLDEPLVFFRDAGGQPVALADKCPHRFAPLSMGTIVNHEIQCAYHGLRFGANGRCTHNPHGPLIAAAKVSTYPLVERHGLVWIWMGDAGRAAAESVPDYSLFTATDKYAVVTGKITVPGHYQLVIDNLLDLSHAQFLHPLLGNPDSSERTKFGARTDGNTVWSLSDMPGEPVSKLFEMMWPSGPKVGDKRTNMRWDPPSNLLLDVGYAPCGGPRSEGPSMPSAHILTPENDHSTHYFWAAARDSLRDDAALSEKIRIGIDATFSTEDGPVIAACQQRMGTSDLMSLKPLLLRTDAAAVSARRVLEKLIAEEQVTS